MYWSLKLSTLWSHSINSDAFDMIDFLFVLSLYKLSHSLQHQECHFYLIYPISAKNANCLLALAISRNTMGVWLNHSNKFTNFVFVINWYCHVFSKHWKPDRLSQRYIMWHHQSQLTRTQGHDLPHSEALLSTLSKCMHLSCQVK